MPKITIKDYFLSVVIPVYNEQKRMPKNLDRIIFYLKSKRFKHEIIIVDDGSRDQTFNVLNKYRKKYPNIIVERHTVNKGKGAAVKTGMLKAKGDLVLMTDCDLSTPIEEIERLMPYIGKYDVVIGSRRLDDRKVERKPQRYRTFMGSVYYETLRLILLPGIKDTNCGFKLFTKKVVKDVFKKQKIKGWGYDAETLFLARENGYSIKEMSVKWTHHSGSKVRVLNAAIRTVFELFMIKVNDISGKYN